MKKKFLKLKKPLQRNVKKQTGKGHIPTPYLFTPGDTPQDLLSGFQYILPVYWLSSIPHVKRERILDHAPEKLSEGLPLLGVGGSEVLGDCSHALNAGGEGGLLHTGVLGS